MVEWKRVAEELGIEIKGRHLLPEERDVIEEFLKEKKHHLSAKLGKRLVEERKKYYIQKAKAIKKAEEERVAEEKRREQRKEQLNREYLAEQEKEIQWLNKSDKEWKKYAESRGVNLYDVKPLMTERNWKQCAKKLGIKINSKYVSPEEKDLIMARSAIPKENKINLSTEEEKNKVDDYNSKNLPERITASMIRDLEKRGLVIQAIIMRRKHLEDKENAKQQMKKEFREIDKKIKKMKK